MVRVGKGSAPNRLAQESMFMKTRNFSLIVICGALAFGLSMARAEMEPAKAPLKLTMPMSAGLDEVVKLTKAGVSESVVISYVQNSPVAYHPSADEIIKLRENGVSAPIITAVLSRGAVVRDQAAQQAQVAQVPAPTAVQTAPVVTPPLVQPTVAYTAPVVYAEASPSVVYIGSSYPTYPFSFGFYGFPFYYHGYYGGYRGHYYHSYGGRYGGGHYGGGHYGGRHFGGSRGGGGGFRHGR